MQGSVASGDATPVGRMRDVRVPAESKLGILARDAQAGASSARRTLMRRIAPVILSAARRIVDETDAEDVAQEAMIVFARDLRSLRNPDAVRAFAVRLTTRVALRARHKRNQETEKRSRFAQELSLDRQELADPLAAREAAEHLLGQLDVLPEQQSETLLLRYFMGLSLEEVAQATDVSVNTVRSRVRLARKTLGRHLVESRGKG